MIETLFEEKKAELVVLKRNHQIIDLGLTGENSGNVYLLINGKVILRKHSVEDPFDFNIVSIVRPGTFIGAPDLDMGQSNLPQMWPVVASHYANFLVIPRSEFSAFWRMTVSEACSI
jgi:hypothetical protein